MFLDESPSHVRVKINHRLRLKENVLKKYTSEVLTIIITSLPDTMKWVIRPVLTGA